MSSTEKTPPCPPTGQEDGSDTTTQHRSPDDQASTRRAIDVCDHWCVVDREEHETYRDDHGAVAEAVRLWGSTGDAGTLYLRLTRPYVHGLPLDQAGDRHAEIELSIGDDPGILRVLPAVARSLAAALVRVAELEEANPRRG